MCLLGSLLGVSQGCSAGVGWAAFLSGAQQPFPNSHGGGQNSVPVVKDRVPVFSLAVTWCRA